MRFNKVSPKAGWPIGSEYLQDIFDRVTARRQFNGRWPEPVLNTEVEASLKRLGLELEAWEHDALDAMERAWVMAMRAEIQADEQRYAK